MHPRHCSWLDARLLTDYLAEVFQSENTRAVSFRLEGGQSRCGHVEEAVVME
jgi:glycerol-3-phosphate O-acyltransferase